MRRGQVWTWVRGAERHPVLVISNDEYNALPEVPVWALVIVPGLPQSTPFGVHMCSDDPLPGASVSIPGLVQILDRGSLTENHGYLAPGTLDSVEDALREFMELT
ncbi:type II toxin-antitoxin system PemK/MazF family toxin [Paractinoplanes ferrugineus]|uniref:type II toxin-antitoxin system PemK/MazF family toxin n=1 Tax=Paractinoplanes ferrugineus TaxID=113564 RepID=UPI0019426629|nr:type II toxin-antitoxin system PemK/MazF family toxin [Actinoplanes ferrugineus]